MRLKLVIYALIIVFLYLFLAYAPNISAIEEGVVVLGAHRGSSVEHKENTIDSIRYALNDSRYGFIEFDLQYTKDKEIVLFHDYTLIRMEKKIGKINDMEYSKIENMTEFHVPKYEEVMDIIGNKKKMNIEIKPHDTFEEDKEMIKFLVEDLKKRRLENKVVISSISSEIIEYISKNHPSIKTGIIYWIHPVTYIQSRKIVEKFYENVENIGADYVMLHGVNLKNYSF